MNNDKQKSRCVVFATSIRPDVLGGGEKWLFNTACGLRARGYDIHLIAYPDSKIGDLFKKDGFTVHPVKMGCDFNWIGILNIRKILDRLKPRALFLNMNKDVSIAGVAGRLCKVPMIVFRNGYPLLQKKMKHKLLMPFFDVILSNSRALVPHYQSFGWSLEDKIQVIYNGIEMDSGLPKSNKKKKNSEWLILGAGRFSGIKQFDQWIQIVHRLSQKYPVKGVLAGDGAEKSNLMALAKRLKSPVDFVGFVESLTPWLKKADLFLHTSRQEGMPNVILEAMKQGVPVVATDAGGTAELVLHGETGFICPVNDVDCLQKSTAYLIDNEQVMNEFSKKGYQRIEDMFSIEHSLNQLEKLIYSNNK